MANHEKTAPAAPDFEENLGGGLFRRWSNADDRDKIAECMATVFRHSPDEAPNVHMESRARIFFSPEFPLMGPNDFAIVEDRSLPDTPVVACTCIWSHRWSYGGIPFGVGRPEYVATRVEYRRRGLMRALFEMIHARSEARGELLQGITGIPYYYRQFGYEYALDLDGHRLVDIAKIPAKKGDEVEPYRLREATDADVPHLVALYNQRRAGSLVWSEGGEKEWRAYITLWNDEALRASGDTVQGLEMRLAMIVDKDKEICGFMGLGARRRSRVYGLSALELYRHVNWQVAMPSLLRAVVEEAKQAPTFLTDGTPLEQIALYLGGSHPAYEVMGPTLAPPQQHIYPWYIRIADIPRFIRHVSPVLEGRLAQSPLVGMTGEACIDFYRGGLRLQFAQGKLSAVEPWQLPGYADTPSAGCPPLVFIQLLLGYRSLAELRAIYPDVLANDETALLLDILFPKLPSDVWPMGYT